MNIELPGYLTPVALLLGPPFPNGKEGTLVDMGDAHDQHAVQMQEHLTDAQGHAQQVVSSNQADSITAFGASFNHPSGPQRNLVDAGTGSRVTGLGLKTSGGIVLAHKGVTIFQYGVTAAALAEAWLTGGFGAALTPMIEQAGRRALDQTTNAAMNAVMS